MSDSDQLRELFAAWERGDFSTGGELYAEDIRFTATQPEGQIEARGMAELGRFLQRFFADWERYRVELHELEELGVGRYVARATQHGIGRTSRMDITAPVHVAIAMRDGRIVQLEFHLHGREDAVASLGG